MKVYKRVGISYRASTAILCRAGTDLGVTCHGHHDFQLSDDVLDGVHIGHYTFYSKAVVKHPKLMIRAPGVFSREYIKGENSKNVELVKNFNATETKKLILRAIMHINEFTIDATGKQGSDPDNVQSFLGKSLYLNASQYIPTGNSDNNYFIRGTCYGRKSNGKVIQKTLNSFGFGESTYPGCRYAREGRGLCLHGSERTLQSMI